jgi:hypothetical protein
LDESPLGKQKSEPNKEINSLSKRYNKFPYNRKYESAPKNPNVEVPDEESGFGNKKVIKLFYGNNTAAYFNYLDYYAPSGYGNRKIYGPFYQNTESKRYYKFYYDTLEVNFNTPEFSLSFDLLKSSFTNNSSLKDLLNNQTISNLKIYTNKPIKWQMYSDTLPRYQTSADSSQD